MPRSKPKAAPEAAPAAPPASQPAALPASAAPAVSRPQLTPASASAAAPATRPRDISPAELAMLARATGGGPSPATAAMQTDKRIDGLWTINEERNVWVSATGVGWRRLASNFASANAAFAILSACAKQTQTRVDFREDDSQVVQEIYVY
ncbi:MAG TPA: hypothetical protein VF897_01735 [Roseiflexaceae bacterium]